MGLPFDYPIIDLGDLEEVADLDAARRLLKRTAVRFHAALEAQAKLEVRLAAAEETAKRAEQERAVEVEKNRALRKQRASAEHAGLETEKRLQEQVRDLGALNETLQARRKTEDSRLLGETVHWRERFQDEKRAQTRERMGLAKAAADWRRKADDYFERITELEKRTAAAEEKAHQQGVRLWEREGAWEKERESLRRELAEARARAESQSALILRLERRLASGR